MASEIFPSMLKDINSIVLLIAGSSMALAMILTQNAFSCVVV